MSSIEKEIIAEKKKLSVLMREKYSVDAYQREYKWERKHIEQLLVDLEASFISNYEPSHSMANIADYNGYYLGPIVVCKNGRNRSIVDGQQRLTSITLLFIYLNSLQKDCLDPEEIDSLIFSKKAGVNSYNLDIPQRKNVLDHLYKNEEYNITEVTDVSVVNMYNRYWDIYNLYPDSLKGRVLPLFIEWLKENVVFVEILAHSSENAYTIFETMNDRGLNLTPAEMLKGYILSNISDQDKVEEIDKLWKEQIAKLHKYSAQEEQEFLKAWLRGVYADSIRASVKGAENEDFEKIGTRFHTWVKDNHKRIGLKDSESFYLFIKGEFKYYSELYQLILNSEFEYFEELEILFLSSDWCLANSLAYPLLLASIDKLDDLQTVHAKLNAVYRFLDIFTVARSINYKSNSQAVVRQFVYSLIKEIRNTNLNQLKAILKEKLTGVGDQISGLMYYSCRLDNKRFTQYLLARITFYLERYNSNPIDFTDLMPSRKKNRYVLAPIIDFADDRYENLFLSEEEYYNTYKQLGNFVLLSNSVYNQFSEDSTLGKFDLLRQSTIFNMTLLKSQNEIGEKLGLLPIDSFTLESIKNRTYQITKIARMIWNPELI